METFLQERGLVLSPDKTVVTPISEGVDFLGQHLRTYRGTRRITPSTKNVTAFLDKVRSIIDKSQQVPAGELIEQLNSRIRGWAFFHRHVSSGRTYARLDHAIFCALWAWARRRHPNKGAAWVRSHYFHTMGNRHWVFSGTVAGRDGQPVTVTLYATTKCHFQRHIKVKAQANPYDPAWRTYFAARRARHKRLLAGTDSPSASKATAAQDSSQAALPFTGEAFEGLEPCAVMNRTHGSEGRGAQ